MVNVPVAMQRQVPYPSTSREQIQAIIVEESDVLVPRAMEEIPEALKPIPQERVQSDTVERIADVPVSQIQEKIVGVIHLILQERIYERIEEKFASKVQEELLKAIQLIRKARISERIAETLMDVPVPQIRKETGQVTQRIPQDPSSGQRTRSSAGTQVRQATKSEAHVGNYSVSNVTHSLTGECPVSRPLMEETMQKTVDVPQIQFIDRAVDVPVFMQRQVPIVQKVQKIEEVPQAQSTDNVMDVPMDMQREVPAVQVVQKTVKAPQTQSIDRVVDTPVVQQRQVTNGTDGPEDHGESTSAVPRRGCWHARCSATQGAHGPEGAENS